MSIEIGHEGERRVVERESIGLGAWGRRLPY
jgi:hypothetical protein